MKIAVVILNYNNYSDTIAYVRNLKELNWKDICLNIVIVDNGSTDGSRENLNNLYRNDDKVDIILSDINLGFSKGNNLGIRYAKDKLGVNLIAVSNNDIKIEDKNFFVKLSSIYEKEKFSVFGPDIYSLSKNIHQSPIRENCFSRSELINLSKKLNRKIFILKLMKPFHVYDILRCVKKKLIPSSAAISGVKSEKKQYQVVVHGAFFVLGEEYLKEYPDGLYDELFMYLEEDILNYLCLAKKLKIVYEPSVKVLHYDGLSTIKSQKSHLNKLLFELENTVISANRISLFLNECEERVE